LHSIRWESYPLVAHFQPAHDWLDVQSKLGLEKNTVEAYGRGLNDFLTFCQRTEISVIEATKADIASFVEEMAHRPNPKGDNVRYLHSGVGLANATMQQRLTIVRLFFDFLIETDLRLDQHNPVGKGKFTPGRAFAGKRERGLLPHYELLPWIPGDDEWESILEATAMEPIRNQRLLLFAYDGALRRSEVVALEMRDIVIPHQQITIRSEIAKNGSGRVVMFGDVARELLRRYLDERAEAGIKGGLLFRSASNRNRCAGITPESWDKIVARIADCVGLQHRFTTHTTRHLRLTDLARTGMDLHAIAQYAGHRSLETTKIYIKLSGRETAERVRTSMKTLDKRLERLLEGGVH
jgi:integrase/recombinase XerD